MKSVTDKLEPIFQHVVGLPPMIEKAARDLSPKSPTKHIDGIKMFYDNGLRLINMGVEGRGLTTDNEKVFLEHLAHVIMDTKFLFDSLKKSGNLLGEDFPYLDLWDKVKPLDPAKHDWKMLPGELTNGLTGVKQ